MDHLCPALFVSPHDWTLMFICLYRLLLLSLADTDPLVYPALLTHNVATPVKLAVAAFASRLLQDVVSPPTAQALTVVHALARLVADASLRPGRVRLNVPFAEIWRLLEVDKLIGIVASPRVLRGMVMIMMMVVIVMMVVIMMMVVVLMRSYMLDLARVAVMCFDQCS